MTVTATDSSGHGHEPTGAGTGILLSQPSQADGGKCWDWPGSTVLTDPSAAWANLDAMTVVCAAKGGSTGGNIIEHQNPLGAREGYLFRLLSNNIRLDLRTADIHGLIYGIDAASYPMPSSGWHMIGGSFTAATGSGNVWLDGTAVSSLSAGTTGAVNYQTAATLYLGNNLSGLLDEVAIFSYVLSATRHAAYASALAAGTGLASAILADGPIAYWKFDDVLTTSGFHWGGIRIG